MPDNKMQKPVAMHVLPTSRRAFKLQAIGHDLTLPEYMDALATPLGVLQKEAHHRGLSLIGLLTELAEYSKTLKTDEQ